MNSVKINIPSGARQVIQSLEDSGFKAYVVGGCVRDSLLMKNPTDWDITTSAKPEEIIEVFKGRQVFLSGLKHGTVTVRIDSQNYEVTTFRTEGEYEDLRRPKSVEFVTDLKQDLKRRDFTVNAMAYSEKEGLIDLYGGLDDLNNKLIRTVGNPEERFSEDALRILRGARFVSTLGFSLEEKTKKAMNKLKGLLQKIAVERIFVEMDKLLLGEFVKNALLDCHEIVFEVIPELEKSYKFLQRSKWHKYDVYTHTAVATSSIRAERHLRWCMLLHDVGKPDTFFLDEKGEGHFYGHPEVSERIAIKVLKRLKAPTLFTKRVALLVKYHDKPFPDTRIKLKRLLFEMGEENLLALGEIKVADNLGQATELALGENPKVLSKIEEINNVIQSGDCYKLKDLKINGKDVVEVGFKDKEVGEVLTAILLDVINENIPNEREALLKSLKRRATKKVES